MAELSFEEMGGEIHRPSRRGNKPALRRAKGKNGRLGKPEEKRQRETAHTPANRGGKCRLACALPL